MRYQVIFNQDGWGVRDMSTGRLTDSMLASAGAAQAVARSHEDASVELDERLARAELARTMTAADVMAQEG